MNSMWATRGYSWAICGSSSWIVGFVQHQAHRARAVLAVERAGHDPVGVAPQAPEEQCEQENRQIAQRAV